MSASWAGTSAGASFLAGHPWRSRQFTKFFLILATDASHGLIQSQRPLRRERALRMSVKSLQGEPAGLPMHEGVQRLIVCSLLGVMEGEP
jgi:hypothetical protein